MTLEEIYKLALNRVGEREGDRQIENIIMSGINAAYKLIAIKNKKSKTSIITTQADIPSTLPDDFVSLVMVLKNGVGRLSQNEYFMDSDILLVTNPDMIGELTLIYNFIPNDLDLYQDSDVEPSIQTAYHSALAAYASYYYYNHINNPNAAMMCLNEFNSITGLADQVDFEKTNEEILSQA